MFLTRVNVLLGDSCFLSDESALVGFFCLFIIEGRINGYFVRSVLDREDIQPNHRCSLVVPRER